MDAHRKAVCIRSRRDLPWMGCLVLLLKSILTHACLPVCRKHVLCAVYGHPDLSISGETSIASVFFDECRLIELRLWCVFVFVEDRRIFLNSREVPWILHPKCKHCTDDNTNSQPTLNHRACVCPCSILLPNGKSLANTLLGWSFGSAQGKRRANIFWRKRVNNTRWIWSPKTNMLPRQRSYACGTWGIITESASEKKSLPLSWPR